MLAKALIAIVVTVAAMALLLFAAAGALSGEPGVWRWWQAWAWLSCFAVCAVLITADLARRDPALLARRLSGGPWAEREPAQRRIMSALSLGWMALLVVPGLDRRFGLSHMPAALALVGDVATLVSYAAIAAVFRTNSHTAATIRVESGQRVVTTGPYGLVRHPMYAAALPMLLGMVLALGSWWSLAVLAAMLPFLILRILDEERVLKRDLPGYRAYMRQVRFRLVPGLW